MTTTPRRAAVDPASERGTDSDVTHPDDAREKVDELEEEHVHIPADDESPSVDPRSATSPDRDEEDPSSPDAGRSEPPD
ncbi:hypothetical protein AAFP35_18310 [Gordonia sp. CPCC 206044]|uniref:hypothetical protein n=1 Tax=Gordonia sp. CPCC 206044 TaxID=3140793 RepID=UPI003AF3980E